MKTERPGSIIGSALCASADGEIFWNDVNAHISDYQLSGWDVEIQYQMSDRYFSAFVIARKP